MHKLSCCLLTLDFFFLKAALVNEIWLAHEGHVYSAVCVVWKQGIS